MLVAGRSSDNTIETFSILSVFREVGSVDSISWN